MSIVSTTSHIQYPASTEISSMGIAPKDEVPSTKFKKRRPTPLRRRTTRYEPYPETISQPTRKSKAASDEELEEGEIIEEEVVETSTTNRNSLSPASTARQNFVQQIQQLKLINEPCPIFCTSGTCTSICARNHDKSRIAICPTFLQQQPCKKFQQGKCNLTHEWNFHVAPSCISFLLGICYTAPCCFAHNDHVCAFSAHCEQYKILGFCDKGAECNRIHLTGDLPRVIVAKQLDERARKLGEAKQKAKISCLIKKQLPTPPTTPRLASPVKGRPLTARRSLGIPAWAEEVEVVLGGEKEGELALQEDFVPFC